MSGGVDIGADWARNSSSALEELQEEYIFDRVSIQVIFIIMYSIVFIFCFFGNLMVLLVVSLHWRMRHITKFCMANLALADFMVGIFCVYQNLATYLINSWVLGKFMCKMYQFINAMSHTASIFTLMVVCVERYFAILHPLKCKQILTKRKLRIIVAAVWVLSCLYCSPRLYYMNLLEIEREDGTGIEIICTAQRNLYSSRAFDMMNSLLLFILPLLFISVLYFRVGLVLWGNSEEFAGLQRVSSSTNTRRRSSSSSPSRKSSGRRSLGDSSPNIETTRDDELICVSLNERIVELPRESKRKVQGPIVPNGMEPSDNRRAGSVSQCPSRDQGRSWAASTSLKEIMGDPNGKHAARPVLSSSYNSKAPRRKHSKVSKASRKLSEEHFELQLQEGQREKLKSRRSVIKMLIAIVICFAVCNLPFHLRKFAVYWWPQFINTDGNEESSFWSMLSLPLSYLCLYGNSAINPIIYAFMSSSFRASVYDSLTCRWKRSFELHNNYSQGRAATTVSIRTAGARSSLRSAKHI